MILSRFGLIFHLFELVSKVVIRDLSKKNDNKNNISKKNILRRV